MSEGPQGMCKLPPPFSNPPPKGWKPNVGDRLLLYYGGKVHEVVVTMALENEGYIVAGDSLILPVACGRDSLRPLEET